MRAPLSSDVAGYIATNSASNAVCLINAGANAYFAMSGRTVAMVPMQLRKGQTPYCLRSLPHQVPCKHRYWKTYLISGQELNSQTYQTPSCKKTSARWFRAILQKVGASLWLPPEKPTGQGRKKRLSP